MKKILIFLALFPTVVLANNYYDGSAPLRCGQNVNCTIQSEVVKKMQTRWFKVSRATHYGSACLDAINTIKTMHPAAYGNGNPGFVQPQMDVCNIK